VLPNVVPFLIVTATLEAASAILLEAALSFLGLGVQPPAALLGPHDLGGQALHVLFVLDDRHPGTCLAILIFAVNLLGDGLRDAISPDAQDKT
jgi:peptide/nickel transport system permease protein